MLDPRIYRATLLTVVLAAIVFAFALRAQPTPLGTTLLPDAFSGQNAYTNMVDLAGRYAHRTAGSAQDRTLAGVIARSLKTDGFAVSSEPFTATTPVGSRRLHNVVAVREGMASSAIVVVAHRDALGPLALAEQSGTGVLLELGRVLQGETLNHTIVLVSTTGSIGTAGAAHLAASLGQPVDAVIALGDMAGTDLNRPLVVPWSDGQQLAPPLLRNTVAAALRAQAGLNAGSPSVASQLAHLAFPLALTEQGPLNAHGIPAVLLSASGDMPPAADQSVSLRNIERLGRTTLQIIDALDASDRVPAPSAYLSLMGKEIPAWAVSLLVLAAILPVAATVLDGFARARRRGYAVARPIAWVGGSAGPFLAGVAVVLIARAAGLLNVAPPGPAAPGTVPLRTGGAVLLAVLAAVIVTAFAAFWAVGGIRALAGRVKAAPRSSNGNGRRHRSSARANGNGRTDHLVARANGNGHAHHLGARGDGNGHRHAPGTRVAVGRPHGAKTVGHPGVVSAILITLCVLVVIVWSANPFAALLLVPALHLWMAALAPEPAIRPAARIVLLALGFVLPALLVAYYAVTLGFGPIDLAWNGLLMVAGGQIGIPVAILLCVLMGCGVSTAVNVFATSWAQVRLPPTTIPITVRGPVTYAGPGSLGGTASALSRSARR